jgi:hypothetical protein
MRRRDDRNARDDFVHDTTGKKDACFFETRQRWFLRDERLRRAPERERKRLGRSRDAPMDFFSKTRFFWLAVATKSEIATF